MKRNAATVATTFIIALVLVFALMGKEAAVAPEQFGPAITSPADIDLLVEASAARSQHSPCE